MNIKNSGIYIIKNIINNKIYIGSSRLLNKRKSEHFRRLKKNIHHSIYLQNAYNKYGRESFIFEIIFNCLPEDCLFFENKFFKDLNPSYNISKEASCPMAGRKHHPGTLEKFKTRPVKSGRNHYLYGTKWSKNLREKILKKRIGSKRSSETKKKMSETAKRINSINRIDRTKQYRKIIDNDGIIYESMTKAAELNNLSIQTIYDILKERHSKTRKGKSFKYYES